MVKHLIKDISEKDFRKLDIKVYCHERVPVTTTSFTFKMVEHSLNEILDKNIEYCLEEGWDFNKKELEMPVYIAIHEENNNEYSGYLDKFMNRFTGLQTYQIGFGIRHLYSTRDYYEDHDDYWRVAKKETAVIYRIHLEPREFVLKHKKEITQRISDFEYIETTYDLGSNGEWVERYSNRIIREGKFTQILPYKK